MISLWWLKIKASKFSDFKMVNVARQPGASALLILRYNFTVFKGFLQKKCLLTPKKNFRIERMCFLLVVSTVEESSTLIYFLWKKFCMLFSAKLTNSVLKTLSKCFHFYFLFLKFVFSSLLNGRNYFSSRNFRAFKGDTNVFDLLAAHFLLPLRKKMQETIIKRSFFAL